MNYYLGIDSGGTYLKACLFDTQGQEVAMYRQSANVISQQKGWVERSLDQLWQETCAVIRGVLEKSQVNPQLIKGISISAQGKGLYLLDKQSQPLRNGILSSDSRSIDIVKQWLADDMMADVYPRTFQTLWTGHPVSILRWVKENEPENYRNIGAIMMSHDFLRFKLGGQIGAELTNISESNFFNALTGNYDIELLRKFGVEEAFDALPEIVAPTDFCGFVTEQAARETGLSTSTQVFGGLFDVVSTAISSGIDSSEEKLNAVMGTWSVTSGITKSYQVSPNHKYVYGHYAIAGEYIIHEASPTSASNYEWLAPYLGNNGALDHVKNQALVAALPVVDSEIIFVPFLYGSNAGLELKSGLYGLQAHHTKGHIIQAVWEGILFCHYVHLQRMLTRFPTVNTLRVTGGTTKSEVWMQMLADLTGLTIELPQVEESGALGAAVIAMVGSGEYQSIEQALAQCHQEIITVVPNNEHFDAYQNKYHHYLRFIEAIKSYEGIA